MNILLIDNYDSFTYNLYQALSQIDNVNVEVFRNDKISINQVYSLDPDSIILSPGPGNPGNKKDFGICKDILQSQEDVPILGVCLGHQGIGLLEGANIINADYILHGKTSKIHHSGSGIFEGIPQGISVARYHSLIIEKSSIPEELDIIARTENDEIMAIQHKHRKLVGVQFHPESFLTEYGQEILQNYVEMVNKQKLTI